MGKLEFRKYIVFMMAAMVLVSTTGCEPLRKKFIRQKKRDQVDNGIIPVLEPMDYPAPDHDPVQSYAQHYHLIKAWYRDLWTALDDHDGAASIKYTIKQVYSHIDEMNALVVADKQAELAKLKGLLSYYDESLAQPEAMRNRSRIQSDLRAFHHQLLVQLNPKKFSKENFIPAQKD